jgi:hypothetical protein
MSRILVGEMATADEDFGLEVGQMWLILVFRPETLIQLSMIHMDQMILSEPSIIIIWTYQDMMECMSRILVGEMACADEDFGLEVGRMWLILVFRPETLIQLSIVHMDQMILSEPSIIIIWTYQDMMECMSRILVGEMAGADEDFGLEVGPMWLILVFRPETLIQLSMIHMDQMILSEP